ncbi:hypothetical protein [Phyllobacterium salinisoli]|uniref:hypothetical protein n=1 Tax=Phyllobacterium salinisoli TaxID=1899321 RepID=UPI00190F488B|nr:hypothetical protein [Phyllobacterium salinisoli]
MSKRELIDWGTGKRYARRDQRGKFQESVHVSGSLSAEPVVTPGTTQSSARAIRATTNAEVR